MMELVQQQKRERRKEQNRRAQAKLRKKQQDRVEELERQVSVLGQQPPAGSAVGLTAAEDVFGDLWSPDEADDREQVGQLASSIPSHYPQLEGSPRQLAAPDSAPIAAGAAWDEALQTSAVIAGQGWEGQCRDHWRMPWPQQHKVRLCAFDALAENARALGLSKETLIAGHSRSPFFSPLSATDTDRLPAAFRPTMAQLSYHHHPYIDCIPLPGFRSRIILAASHRPPLVDWLEVWHDVLVDGLTSGADPQDGGEWTMSEEFVDKWGMLLSIDLSTLQARTLCSNPPVRLIIPGAV